MAIYQYYLGVIPKQSFGTSLPEYINVRSENGYFKSDAETYWKGIDFDLASITSKIDLLVDKTRWSNNKTSFNWKTYTDEVDNDAAIYLDESTLVIKDFSFRADLREKDLLFLRNMIELGKVHDLLFFDRKGKLMNPELEEIIVSIQNSNAYSFLKDPMRFLKNTDNE